MSDIYSQFWAFKCILYVLQCFCNNAQILTDENDGFCTKDCETSSNVYRLPQRDGFEVGHVEKILLNDGHVLEQVTLSLEPLLFEMRGFLSDADCDHLIAMATRQGLKDSVTVRDDHMTPQNIKLLDIDQDKKLNINEMMLTVENAFDIYLTEEDVKDMYAFLDLDNNDDGLITPDELENISTIELADYLSQLVDAHPMKQSRYSKQIWLYPDSESDEVFRNIQDRVLQVTKLPEVMIKKSDFQVVHYGVGGHYNAHQDSNAESETVPCCTETRKKYCRICRFMTVLFYLNDVQEGGGTAFPVAGNETYDEQELRVKHMINLQKSCDDANLIVQPERGKVVMWYNHHIDVATGWVGDLDVLSWHGGCPVKHGEKWIANFWIKYDDDRDTFMWGG